MVKTMVKNWKGIAPLATFAIVAAVLVIVVAALVTFHLLSAGSDIPPDQVEVIVVRHENEPSFDIAPLTGEGDKLLSKCEDVLSNLSAHAEGFYFEDEVAGIREKSAYIEIVFKENYEVPIYSRWSGKDVISSSRVLFVLSGGDLGDVLFRTPEPSSPLGNGMTFIWNWYEVESDDRARWRIFQELVDTVNETQPL